ncbi:MAG: flagellar biosynthesis protein FlhA, partial [Sphingomonadales bacterium 63-6]
FILIVVQYVVVTSGAQRVSEVAARFTLDSMPGQQMSIDADLNLGLIDQKQAIERREELEKEASFYGAMDGASKFVKGDAIAGIIILLIDIIAGLIVGVAQMGMGWGEALERFTLLTIGDGIATQLPALIISIATGIIVTRSAADKELSTEIFRQMASEPRIPVIVMVVMSLLMLLPGMPKWPIAILLGIVLFAWLRIRKLRREEAEDIGRESEEEQAPAGTTAQPPLEIAFGAKLAEAWGHRKALLLERISTSRVAHERAFGLAFPAVRFVESDDLGGLDYRVNIHGTTFGMGQLHPDRMLAIAQREDAPRLAGGLAGRDPAFGIAATWIEPAMAKEATQAGYSVIDPETVMITHFVEIVRAEAPSLLTRAVTGELLDALRERQPGLVEELIPNIMTLSDVQRILQNLLRERVSIANLDLIVETLVDVGRGERDPLELTEKVRQALSTAICNGLKGQNAQLSVLSLDPRLENRIISGAGTAEAAALGMEPRLAEQLLRGLAPLAEAMMRQGKAPVLLCAGPIRRLLVKLTQRSIPQLSVLSVDEVPMRIALHSFDVVKVEG